MCSIDLEPCEVFVEHTRKARKHHKCDACSSPINPGKSYLVHFSVYDGSPLSEKMCMPCNTVRKRFANEHGQSFTPSSLLDMLNECVDYGDDDAWKWRVALSRISKRTERLTKPQVV